MHRAPVHEQPVRIPAAGVVLDADLAVPPDAVGVVLFAHGSGSGRHSPRNRRVAADMNEGGLATVLADLLTAEEEQVDMRTRHLRFDVELLASRLEAITGWAQAEAPTADLRIGLFGASTGAGAALKAVARRPPAYGAVVSRGGRPDLAGPELSSVQAPTLLIVGGRDPVVMELNEEALTRLGGEKRLEVVSGASHLFEEAGALDQVAHLAREWFSRHLGAGDEAKG